VEFFFPSYFTVSIQKKNMIRFLCFLFFCAFIWVMHWGNTALAAVPSRHFKYTFFVCWSFNLFVKASLLKEASYFQSENFIHFNYYYYCLFSWFFLYLLRIINNNSNKVKVIKFNKLGHTALTCSRRHFFPILSVQSE